MEIGGASSLLGFNRNNELLKLTKIQGIQDNNLEKTAYSAKGKSAKTATPYQNLSEEAQKFLPSSEEAGNGAGLTLAASKTSQTLFYAQQIASADPEAKPIAQPVTEESEHSKSVAAFLDIIGQTPGERMRAQILKSMGITEEALENMSPEERMKIELQIAQLMEDKVKSSIKENLTPQSSSQTGSNSGGDKGKGQMMANIITGNELKGETLSGAEKGNVTPGNVTPGDESRASLRKAILQNIV